MFTGIIEATGTVAAATPSPGGLRVRIETPLAAELTMGASVAVNGACLTAVALDAAFFEAEIGPETARVTTLGTLASGQRVNLERPLRLGGRLDGHFVLGHVDGVATVEHVREEAGSHWLSIAIPDDLAPYFIRKGSVTVDGVSLTVATLERDRFAVQIIPYTWLHTTLGALQPGARVNLECDMVGKYVLRGLEIRT